MQNRTPTSETYHEFQTAFDFFNAELFGAAMPQCLITLQRHNRSMGYYHAERFVAHDGASKVDEIALKPAYFPVLTIENTLSTLVHEMVHLWQFHHGVPSRMGYHNREWADKMEAVGLMPSHTGRAGGCKVGQQMDHYVIGGGPFSVACATLLTRDFRLSWYDRFPAVDPAWSLITEAVTVSSLAELDALVQGEREDEPQEAPATRCPSSAWTGWRVRWSVYLKCRQGRTGPTAPNTGVRSVVLRFGASRGWRSSVEPQAVTRHGCRTLTDA